MTTGPTLAELLFGGPLSGASVHPASDLDRPVHEVRIVDDLAALTQVTPGSAVVLTARAARGEWAVETALRRAWERAAACLVSPAASVDTPGPALVAARLRTPLVTVTEDPYRVALALARAIGSPGSARADVVAECAAALTDLSDPTGADVLDTLHRTVPATRFALVSTHQGVLAGDTGAEADDEPEVRTVTDGVRLVAALSTDSDGLRRTVRIALGMAAPLIATRLLADRLAATLDNRLAGEVLGRLLEHLDRTGTVPSSSVLARRCAGFGWPLRGRVLPVALTGPGDGAEVPAAWASAGGAPMLARSGTAWVTWLPAEDPDDTIGSVEALVAEVNDLVPLVGGVGPVLDGIAGLAEGLSAATDAAALARGGAPGLVARHGTVTPNALLAALPTDLTRAARRALDTLLSNDPDLGLLRTLGALLDTGGSTSAAAELLGVHRNTITARAQRLRTLGIDPAELPDRLAIHLACHLLLRSTGENDQRG
ncbi:PucR family transcriptional regulator [Pseudonocardia spinosispora]|uniref:PucR family transcriptional regulator n=1 Tax=Pseudonocardia spinosispora TaxID=103441 RepID=UPI00041D1E12|nr:PucR family transcriptional regulator [Pseudonocardia spinosispora]